ncbi:hypothetical protein Cgig2_011380 [Carnegiea gigantea]|uniref:FAS1 domain-containing protein n=1 Tax=Carnegiea gigantea TaxID=171969 RepID=A0A9Q1KS83_9CARY|nr:hypothetical protein Cgig2_011380 [Carnegiea gigantea]
MASKIASFVVIVFVILLSATTMMSFDITKLLQHQADFSTFNEFLAQTGLATNINNRQAITVFAIDNGGMGSITSKPREVIKNILATHVVLDYCDTNKLADFANKQDTLTTLFQTTGFAMDRQGFLKVSESGNDVVVGSAVDNAPQSAKVLKSIVSEPYNISVLQISQPIMTPGISQIAPAGAPRVESPTEAHKVESPAEAHKVESPAEAHKVESPAEEHKVESPAAAHNVESPTETHKVESPADHAVESPAEAHSPKNAHEGKAPESESSSSFFAHSPSPNSDASDEEATDKKSSPPHEAAAARMTNVGGEEFKNNARGRPFLLGKENCLEEEQSLWHKGERKRRKEECSSLSQGKEKRRVLLSATTIMSFDITKLLQQQADFSTFNEFLAQTGLATNINNRQAITIFAVDNGGMGSITSKPREVIKSILATHVVLDYCDTNKLADFANKQETLTTLFQATGFAMDRQGFLKVSKSGDDIVVGSAVDNAPQSAKVLKSIVSEPYNISVLQISQPIMTPGISQIAPAGAPRVESPTEAHKVESPAEAHKVESPAETHKVESPAEEHKVESPAATHNVESPAETHKVESPADHKAESPAEAHSPENTHEGKAPESESDDSSSSAHSPSPKGDASDEEAADKKSSPPHKAAAARMTNVGGVVLPTVLMGLVALAL